MSWILGVLGSDDGTLTETVVSLTGRRSVESDGTASWKRRRKNHARKTKKKLPPVYLVHAMTVTLLLYDMIPYHMER
jgi:hypothetical protein